MALPGIISCLHPVTTPAELARQLQQGQQTRAEAFWLPAALHDQAAAVLAALDDKSSLFLSSPQPGCHCAVTTASCRKMEPCCLVMASIWRWPKSRAMAAWSPSTGWPRWQLARSRPPAFCCSAAVQPVARAILNIWPLDPYLARHFCAVLHPYCAKQPRPITWPCSRRGNFPPWRNLTGFRPI